jgi:VIT1/CCC1 family predicted Fe2+/Mn2+ transporter
VEYDKCPQQAAFAGNNGASMNETLANLTVNSTNFTLNASTQSTSSVGNETVKVAINSAGNFGLDKLLNMEWTVGVAAWLNATFNTTMFSGSIIAALLPIITLAFLYFKWNSVVSFFQTAGQVMLVLLIGYLALKAFGIL